MQITNGTPDGIPFGLSADVSSLVDLDARPDRQTGAYMLLRTLDRRVSCPAPGTAPGTVTRKAASSNA